MMKKLVVFNCLMFISVCIFSFAVYSGFKNRPVIIFETETIPYDFIGEHEITFYTHTGNKTSTGVYPKINRTVAVDNSKIPYGTILYIKGYGLFIAEDSGADIKGNRLDVFVNTKEEAIKKGRVKAKVYTLGKI